MYMYVKMFSHSNNFNCGDINPYASIELNLILNTVHSQSKVEWSLSFAACSHFRFHLGGLGWKRVAWMNVHVAAIIIQGATNLSPFTMFMLATKKGTSV